MQLRRQSGHLIKDELKVLERISEQATLHQPKRTLIGDKEAEVTLLGERQPAELPPRAEEGRGRRTEKEERDLLARPWRDRRGRLMKR